MNAKFSISCFLLFLLFLSCREVYYPDDLQTGKVIPVIKGQIAENESPSVVLSWAMNYDRAVPDYISGACVMVTDDKGNEVTLVESSPGYYEDAQREMYGTVGTAYQLQVKLESGEEFISSMVTMPEKPTIDSLFAEPGTKKAQGYDMFNNPISVIHEGLHISSSISAFGDSTHYFRFSTSVLKESTCIRDPGTVNAIPMFIWEPYMLDYIYSVDFTVKSGDRQVRPMHSIGFLRYLYDPSQASLHFSAPIIIGWVLTYKVIAISSDVYNYYQSIGTQLNSGDQIFAPVPSQVKSNIRCITNPDLPIVGVFEAISSTTCHKAFRWIDLNSYEFMDLESFPSNIEKGSKLYFPPSFWVSFN